MVQDLSALHNGDHCAFAKGKPDTRNSVSGWEGWTEAERKRLIMQKKIVRRKPRTYGGGTMPLWMPKDYGLRLLFFFDFFGCDFLCSVCFVFKRSV